MLQIVTEFHIPNFSEIVGDIALQNEYVVTEFELY